MSVAIGPAIVYTHLLLEESILNPKVDGVTFGTQVASLILPGQDPALAALQADDPAFDPADPTGGGVATLSRPRTNPKVDPNNPSTWGKVSRNAPCPCGSGKKFKHCHGRV